MSEFDVRTQSNMDLVLEEICSELPNGGDHQTRRCVAETLVDAARSGKTTLGELYMVARRALSKLA
ncbi:hypothetical protein XH99_01400 [Bradyrhizobium nanningense]|uniref:Uncharacterized protein n=1 Tax=Bradyrhizobium nanningense TaxID=1325118 RepID=A0A4Q0SIV4_9BRAD|nr:hypothetical protein [Bradyrhizobium nanningense]RXH23967.1 hypothetical protein XH84_33295 [Bradyrhizobium nanningense]RXH38428.1 hypothetical protein XH99_01400 [Bradyrhizobium nanningense]